MRDFFHFIQANVRKAGQLGLKSCAHNIVVGLNVLWYKTTKKEFDVNLNDFLDEWDRRASQYSAYFRSTWLERYQLKEWASYTRPNNVRSGIKFFFLFLS
jgi:hypothetical protein